MIELKPCPFCGGEAEIDKSCDYPAYYRVSHSCLGRASIYKMVIYTNWRNKPEQAAELWNARKDVGEE